MVMNSNGSNGSKGSPMTTVQVGFDTEKQEACSLWFNGDLPKRQMEKIKRGERMD